MTQLRIDSLSLMYKKSPDPGNFPTASRQLDREPPRRQVTKAIAPTDATFWRELG
jgi:hypothetical protein